MADLTTKQFLDLEGLKALWAAVKAQDTKIYDLIGDTSAFENYFVDADSTIPVETVIQYINAKTAGIATDTALEALQRTVDELVESASALEKISGENAIVVTDSDSADNTVTPVISLKLAEGDNAGNVVLTQDANGLKAEVEIPEVTHPEYSIVKDETSADYAAVYHLTKDGTNVGVAINIPKDLVVKSGRVEDDNLILVLNDEAATEITIPVASLIEYVTSGSAEGDDVIVAVSGDYKVTATLSDAIKDSLALADSAVQKVEAGSANGTIAVDGTDVAVTGLDTAAYKKVEDFDAAGSAQAVYDAMVRIDESEINAICV